MSRPTFETVFYLAAQQSGQDAGTSAEATSSTEPANPPIQSRAITTVTQATPTPGPSVPVSLNLFQVMTTISKMCGVGAGAKRLLYSFTFSHRYIYFIVLFYCTIILIPLYLSICMG